MCGRFKIWVLVAVLLQPITSDDTTENKLMDSTKNVIATNVKFISTPEITKNIEATDITKRIQFKDTTKTDQITDTAKKIQVESSNDYDDLFTMENIALELPVRSAVHALNMKLLRDMLLKKLTAKLGKHVAKK
ncbi:putative next to BRCA1 protein [Dirofilaria immitis]